MATLNIEGRTVNVDDAFLKLSPDQQNSTVEEIAKSFAPKDQIAPEAADHGLSERQKLSPLGKAISPITGSWDTYQRMNKDARGQMSRGVNQIANSESLVDPSAHGISDVASGVGNIALGGLGYIASPINAAYRSIVGQPIEDVTGIPREIPEFAAQLATPGIGLPGLARTGPAMAPSAPAAAATGGNGIVDAAQRVSQVAPEAINVPRAFASDSMAAQRAGQMARNVPIMGDAIPRATGEMVDQLGNAVGGIASHYGEGSGPNVASRIGRNVSGAAEAEMRAATDAARLSDETVAAAHARAGQQANQSLDVADTQALQQARAAVGDMSPQDMGQTLIARLRAGEREAHAEKERLYGIAGNSDGAINADAVRGARNHVAQSLDADGIVIDGQLTPAANRMMTELDNISSLRIPNRVAAPIPAGSDVAAVNMQGIEQTRKRLNSLSQAASNDADRRASRRVIGAFDNWLGNAFDNALFSGSDEALNSFRAARAANTEWRQRFGFNARDDADRVVNRIVTGETTPQEAANYIVGAGKVGAKGVSSRLLTRIAEATGNDPEAMQAIRGGVWNRLSQSTGGVDAKAGGKVANDISEFLNGSGRDVAQRLFTPEQQNVMRTYADTLRRTAAGREHVTEVMANTVPGKTSVGIGPMQELANAVLGKGGKTDEALFSAIDAYAKTGSRGDINTLADLVRNIPAKEKGNLSGSIIRKMGQSTQTNAFSPDLFASEWSKYSPQAKTILFGNAGPHRQALDDIAMISQRYKNIGKQFGNPSGTAQNATGFGAAAWIMASPYTAIPSLISGAVFAKVLASPAGASSAAKWGKAFEALKISPNPQKMIAFQMASRNLANTASSLGSNATGPDFMHLIQSPSKAAADDNQPNVPGRVSQ